MDVRRYDHFLAIIADLNVANLADIDILVAYFCLVDLQTFGIFKAYFDRSALRNFLPNHHEAAHQNDHRRQDPHQRQASPSGSRRHRCRQLIKIRVRPIAHGGASQSNRSSKVRAANVVRTTTAANANAPQPTDTNARDLICTSATRSEMA